MIQEEADECSLRVGSRRIWFARIAVALVFFLNIQCALLFCMMPQNYLYAYGLAGAGIAGEAMIRGLGIAFLMWNATYPFVIVAPNRHRTLFLVILVQQMIGLIGESWLWILVHETQAVLASSIMRFVIFDGAGLVLMGIAFVLTTTKKKVG